MKRNRLFNRKFLKTTLPVAAGVLALSAASIATASGKSLFGHGFPFGFGFGFGRDVDLSGPWLWEEDILVVLPGEVVMDVFGVAESEGPVMILRCQTWGDMTLTQSGNSFDGLATQSSSCTTRGGQPAMHPPFPPGFGVSGSIYGRFVSFSADVGDGIDCSYHGIVRVRFGQTEAVNATGGCDVPAPFEPNVSRSISFDMYRP